MAKRRNFCPECGKPTDDSPHCATIITALVRALGNIPLTQLYHEYCKDIMDSEDFHTALRYALQCNWVGIEKIGNEIMLRKKQCAPTPTINDAAKSTSSISDL